MRKMIHSSDSPRAPIKLNVWTKSLPRFDDVDDPDEPLAIVHAATSGKFPFDGKPRVLIAARKEEGAIDQGIEKGKVIRSKILSLSEQTTLVYAESGHHVQLERPNVVVAVLRHHEQSASH